MASSHHGGDPNQPDPEAISRIREAMEQGESQAMRELELMGRFSEQVEGRAKRKYPQGRCSADDEGELAIAIAADAKRKLIIIDFGKQVDWLGLGEKEVRSLIQMLISKLREISTEPFTLEL